MSTKIPTHHNVSAGFTLLEVLVAILVIALGLLGVAALQSGGMQATRQSLMRTTATYLASDMADRIRTNGAGRTLIPNPYSPIATVSPAPPLTKDCAATTCTALEMATYDTEQWNIDLLNSNLPNAVGTVALSASENFPQYTVTVTWSADVGNPNAPANNTVSLVFLP